jgi:hypothetical protein
MLKRLTVLALLATAAAAHAAIPIRPQINITDYDIHTDLDPATGHMTATAEVTFKALEDLNAVIFGLNNGLQVTSVLDPNKASLVSERNVTDSTIRVTPAAILPKGSTSTWTFTYAGAPTVDTSPVDGIRFAQIADPVSILLYPGRWFPIAMPGLFTDRFTAQMHITVPAGDTVVGSGVTGKKAHPNNRTEFDFNWTKPGFPGTIVAGKFVPPITAPGIPNIRVYVTDPKAKGKDFAATAAASSSS